MPTKLIVRDISTPAMKKWLASHDPIWDKKPQYLIDEANANAKKREKKK